MHVGRLHFGSAQHVSWENWTRSLWNPMWSPLAQPSVPLKRLPLSWKMRQRHNMTLFKQRDTAKWQFYIIWKTQDRSRHFLGSLFFERCAIQYRALERGQCSLNDTAKKSERHSHLMYAIDVLVNLQVKCMFLCFCSQFARPGSGLCSSLARRKWT